MASDKLVLPKYVSFKGDNGYYLCLRSIDGYPYMQFSTTEIAEEIAACEIVPVANGNIRIKQVSNGKFWRRSPDWIWADSSDTTSNNKDTLFTPVQVDDMRIALKNLGNGLFCKRLTLEKKTNCLNAAVASVTSEAKLKVEEPVLRRQIYDFVYDFENAKIYDENPITLGGDQVLNYSSGPTLMATKIEYEDTRISTWNTSFSLKSTVTATATAGIPIIAGVKVVASAETQAGIEWSKTETKRVTKTSGTAVMVPPKSKGSIYLIGKQGKCDVTFTYKQKDTLYDGSTVVTIGNGMYSGSNIYNTAFDVPEYESLE